MHPLIDISIDFFSGHFTHGSWRFSWKERGTNLFPAIHMKLVVVFEVLEPHSNTKFGNTLETIQVAGVAVPILQNAVARFGAAHSRGNLCCP